MLSGMMVRKPLLEFGGLNACMFTLSDENQGTSKQGR